MKTPYSTRKATTCKVTLSCGARVGEGQVLDLTVPGCLLETAFLLEPGQSVQLRVHLDNHRPMRIDLGVVRWAKQGKAGIEFIRMAGDDQHRLRFFVGHIEKRPRPSRVGARGRCVWVFRARDHADGRRRNDGTSWRAGVDATLTALIRHLVLSFPQAAILSRSVGTRYQVCVIVPYDGSPEKTVQAERAVDGEPARSIQEVERQLSQLNLPLLLQTRERYDLRLTSRRPHEPACEWRAPDDGTTAHREDGRWGTSAEELTTGRIPTANGRESSA